MILQLPHVSEFVRAAQRENKLLKVDLEFMRYLILQRING